MNAKEILLKLWELGYSKSTIQKAFRGCLQSRQRIMEVSQAIDETNSEEELLERLEQMKANQE